MILIETCVSNKIFVKIETMGCSSREAIDEVRDSGRGHGIHREDVKGDTWERTVVNNLWSMCGRSMVNLEILVPDKNLANNKKYGEVLLDIDQIQPNRPAE